MAYAMGQSIEEIEYSTSIDTSRMGFFTSGVSPSHVMAPTFRRLISQGVRHFILPKKMIDDSKFGFLQDVFSNAGIAIVVKKSCPITLKGSGETLKLVFFSVRYADIFKLLGYCSFFFSKFNFSCDSLCFVGHWMNTLQRNFPMEPLVQRLLLLRNSQVQDA